MYDIIEIEILSLPILISCFIALAVPMSPRLRHAKYIRNILMCSVFLLCANRILSLMPTTGIFATTRSCMCGMQQNFLPILLYFIVLFGCIAASCKMAKFSYFKNWLTYLRSVFLFSVPVWIFTNGMCCRDQAKLNRLAFILLALIIIFDVIYKKSLKKKA